MKDHKLEIINRLYNQMIDNQKKRLYPPFDPDAHTREEYLVEAKRIDRQIKERGRFWKLLDKLF